MSFMVYTFWFKIIEFNSLREEFDYVVHVKHLQLTLSWFDSNAFRQTFFLLNKAFSKESSTKNWLKVWPSEKSFLCFPSSFCFWDNKLQPSPIGNASRTHAAELVLPLPTCSRCVLQRKASHWLCSRTSMIYEPSVASDVPVVLDRMFPAGTLHRSAWALPGYAKVHCN